MRSEEKGIRLQYVFESEENARLAFRIIETGPDIRARAIERFIVHLRDCLQEEVTKLPGRWVARTDSQGRVLENFWEVWLEKEDWRGLYTVALSSESRGPRGFILGVRNDWNKLKRRADGGRIAGVLQAYRSGKTTDWWPWHFPVPDPYSDWTTVESLEKLHLNSGRDAIDYFVAELIRIAQIAGSVIDQEVAALAAT